MFAHDHRVMHDDHHMHSSGANAHSAQVMAHMAAGMMTNPMDQNSVFALHIIGQDSQCGLPYCCPGDSVKCATSTNSFLPNELEGYLTITELKAMTDEMDELFAKTVMPMFPCMLGHFCLPFSPVCAMAYFASQREKGVQAILTKHNRALAERGLYWECTSIGSNSRVMIHFPFAVLKFNRAARERYLLNAPSNLNAPLPGQSTAVATSVMPMAMDTPPAYSGASAPSAQEALPWQQAQTKAY